MHASKQLARFRKLNKLSMARAGSLVGVDWGTWRRWETGQNTPRVDTALRIADVTGIPVDAWRDASAPSLVKVA